MSETRQLSKGVFVRFTPAQQDVLDAGAAGGDAAQKYRAVAQRYLDALGQFMTPGHLGDMSDV